MNQEIRVGEIQRLHYKFVFLLSQSDRDSSEDLDHYKNSPWQPGPKFTQAEMIKQHLGILEAIAPIHWRNVFKPMGAGKCFCGSTVILWEMIVGM